MNYAVAGFMSLEKCRIVIETFVKSLFNYWPLVWLLHSRTFNNKINGFHERALRIPYSDQKSSFNALLEKDGSFSIHHRDTENIAILIYIYL